MIVFLGHLEATNQGTDYPVGPTRGLAGLGVGAGCCRHEAALGGNLGRQPLGDPPTPVLLAAVVSENVHVTTGVTAGSFPMRPQGTNLGGSFQPACSPHSPKMGLPPNFLGRFRLNVVVGYISRLGAASPLTSR